MTENKRYVQFEFPYDDFGVKDNKTNEELWNPKVVDRLNEQEERIERLKRIRNEQTETILKQKRKMQELEERNKRQYDRLKELTELMYEKQWGKLENMVDDWEKQEELLQAEWGTYCGDKE